ncbi:MAG: hypothetical protein WD078_03260 [Woeseia sp.]
MFGHEDSVDGCRAIIGASIGLLVDSRKVDLIPSPTERSRPYGMAADDDDVYVVATGVQPNVFMGFDTSSALI